MSITCLNPAVYIEIKCPACNRHLDKFRNKGWVEVSRKCKSCKNNIVTEAIDNRVISTQIDARENSKDILTPKRFSKPQG